MAEKYTIIGRFMDGKEVTGYQAINEKSSTPRRFTREQTCFLVGNGMFTNCTGQIYQDKVILRGKGISLEDLPVIQEKTGELSRADNLGKVRKNTAPEEAMQQLMIVGTIVKGRNNIGYVVKNAGGTEKKLSREDTIKLAREGKIGNARVQMNKGEALIRGEGINLNSLPVMQV